MKTLKSLIWLIIVLFIFYIVLIFIKPALTDKISKILGLGNFNEKIRTIKTGIDFASTKIPTKGELEKAYSGAKNKVKEIKKNIDNVRKDTDKIEEKYKQTKEFIDETGKKIDNVKNSLNDLQKVGEDINNVVNKEAIK